MKLYLRLLLVLFFACSGISSQANNLKKSKEAVLQPVTVSATIATTDSSVCLNGTAPTITFTGTGGTAPYTFTYKIGTAASVTIESTGNTATLSVLTGTAGSFDYKLESVHDASTTTQITINSSVTVTVNALPIITGTLNTCVGSTSNLNGSGTASSWTSSDTAVATIDSSGLVTGVSAGQVTITYIQNNGCANTVIFTVKALPVISGNLNTCVGTTSNLNATGAATSWTSSAQLIATVSTSGMVTGVSAGQTTISYTESNGCVNTATFTVKALPAIDFTFIDNQCSGSSVAFNSTTTGTVPFTYVWDFGDGGISSQQNPTHTFTSLGCGTTTFNVSLTVTGANGCLKTITKIVTIKKQPEVSVEDTNAGVANQFSNCATTTNTETYSITVGNTSASTSCISNYSINWGDNTITESNITFPITHTYTIRGVFNMIVTATSSNGCSNSRTYLIKNISNPSGGILNPGGTDNMCLPAPIIQYSIGNWALNSLGTTYTVNYGDTPPTIITLNQNDMVNTSYYNATNPSLSANYPVPYAYTTVSCPTTGFIITLVVTNACKSTTGSVDGGNTIKKPTANFTAPSISCISTNVLFTNTTILGFDAGCVRDTKFTWNFGDPGSGTSNIIGETAWLTTTPNVNHTFSAPGVYTVTLSTRNGCGITTKTQQICIESTLLPQFTLSTIQGCTPLNVTTTNTTNLANVCPGNPTYLWNVTYVSGYCGSGTPSWSYATGSETTANPSFNFVTPGTYSIKVTMTNSCGAVTSSIQNVIVKKPPTVSINAIASICQTVGTTSITPTAAVDSCAPASSTLTYAWGFSGGIPATSNLPNPGTVSYSMPGIYIVSLSVTNECGTTVATNRTFTINSLPTISGTLFACKGQTTTLTGSASPATTNPWISSNTAIATVSSLGVVTGVTAGTATITYTNSNGCQITALFTVNPLGQVTTPANQVVCNGSQITSVTFVTTNTVGTTSYAWTIDTNIGLAPLSGTGNIPSFTASNSGTIPVTATITVTPTLLNGAVSCAGTQQTFTIVVNPTGQIIQPSSQVVCNGSSTSAIIFSTSNTVGTTTYAWTNDTSSIGLLGSGTGNIPSFIANNIGTSAVIATIIITPTFTNGSVSCSGPSKTFTITVNPKPIIAAIIPSAICSGTSFSVTPSSGSGNSIPTGTTYAWTLNANANVTGQSASSVAGITAISQTLTNISNSVQTVIYTVTPTSGAAGNCVGATFTITVTVNPRPLIGNQTATICSATSFSVVPANGSGNIVPSGSTYTWTVTNPSGISGASDQTTGQSSISQVVTNSTNSAINVVYNVTASSGTSPNNCTSTFTVTVTVNPRPLIPNQTAITCSGIAFTTVVANNPPTLIIPAGTTYTWTVIPPTGISGASNQTTGVTTISQTLTNSTSAPINVIYNVTASSGTSPNICTSTFTITVTVNPSPAITFSPATQSICSGTSSLLVTLASTTAGVTFAWTTTQPVGITETIALSGSGTIPAQTFTNTTNVDINIVYTATATIAGGSICAGASYPYTIIVKPKAAITESFATPICSGSLFTVTPIASAINSIPVGTTYSWPVPVVTGGIIGGAVGTSQTSITGTLTNPTNVNQTATYTVTPTSNGCQGASFTVVVTVNPIPVIPVQTAITCSGTAFTVTPTNSGATIVPTGTTYTWTVNTNSNVTGQSASLTAGITAISQTLTNISNSVQTVIYTVTPTSGAAGNCVGATFTITVTVNPKPSIVAITPAAICSATSFSVVPANGSGNTVPSVTTYTWTAPESNPLLAVSGGSAQTASQINISQILSNATDNPATLTYTVTPTSGTCVGNTFTITVTVNPKPKGLNLTNKVFCNGVVTSVIPFTNTVTGTTYAWTNSNTTIGLAATAGVLEIPTFTPTNSGTAPIVATISVTATANGCARTAETFTITVNPSPAITFSPTTQSICSGTSSVVTTLNSTTTGVTFAWTTTQPVGITETIALSGSTTIPAQTFTNTTNVNIIVTYNAKATIAGGSVCAGAEYPFTITVTPTLSIITTQAQTICSGTVFGITPTNGSGNSVAANTLYTWSTPTSNPLEAITSGSAQSTAQAVIGQILTNTTQQTATATYQVTPKTGACSGSPFPVIVTVNPKPVVQFSAGNQTLCSGTNSNAISISTATSGSINYNWTATIPAGISGATVSGTAATIPVQLLTNGSPASLTVTYSAIATITNGLSCSGLPSNYTITVNPSIVTSVIKSNFNGFNVSFAGATDGSIDMTVSGGSGSYTYSWSGPNGFTSTNIDISGLASGLYTLSINDGICTVLNVPVTLTSPLPFIIQEATTAHVNVLCNTYRTGQIKAIITQESIGPYDYVVTLQGGGIIASIQNSSLLDQTFTALAAGLYDVTVTDANGSIKSILGIEITQPAAISASISSQTNVLCNGGTTGSATATAFGGTGTLSYSWNTSSIQIGQTATGLPIGTYIVTVKDSNLCVTTAQVLITEPTVILTALDSQTNILCHGDNTGAATVSATGGVGGYTYSWNSVPIQTSATATNLLAGTYVATIKDSNACIKLQQVTLTEPAIALAATVSNATNVSCYGGNNGTATVTASNGTGPYLYSWNTTPIQTTSVATGLAAGNYTVTVTDFNGCTFQTSKIITQPLVLGAAISAQTNVSCSGTSTGSATISLTGGTSPYSYSWNTAPVQTNATGINLALGTYTVTITDSKNCQTTQQVNITEPNGIVTAIVLQTDVDCRGNATGAVVVSASGGTAPLTYLWDTTPTNTTLSATGLLAGTYHVTITDANLCTKIQPVTITQPTAVLGALISNPINVSCFGGANGSATVTASGGTSPYTYLWNTIPAQTTASISGLNIRNYSVTITDSHLCSTTANVTITQPNELLLSNAMTPIICYGSTTGAIPITITQGSVANYTFSISGTTYLGNPYSATVTQPGLFYSFINLLAGVYSVTVTDANGCSKQIPSINVTQPAASFAISGALLTNFNGFNSSCFNARNGGINLTVAGGYVPYIFTWTGPNGFTAASEDIAALAPGQYSVSIRDAGGCVITNSYTITEPADINIITDLTKNITCFNDADGKILLSISGGTGTYTYSWTKDGNPYATTQDITNLAPGLYVVVVNDTNSCGPKTATFTITQPPLLEVALVNQTNILCFGAATGVINVAVVGGTMPASGYHFAWTGPGGFRSTIQNLANIVVGTYILTVTDNNNCTDSLTVIISQPAVVSIGVVTTAISCYGANDASITLTITGGVAPYQILWTNFLGSGPYQNNLAANTYNIVVTDANNCVHTIAVIVPEAPIYTIIPVVKQITCFGAHNGSINLNIVGGFAPIRLQWEDSPTAGNVRNNLVAGSYSVTITDSKPGIPCVIRRTFVIQEPTLLVLGAAITDALACTDANSGAINLLVAGGTAPYTYLWNPLVTTEDLTNIPAGNYFVTVTDFRGCEKTATYTVVRPSPITIRVITHTDFDCTSHFVKQTFSAFASGGVPPFSLNWSSGTVSGTFNEIMNTNQNGLVILTATDALGCTKNYSFDVQIPILGLSSFTINSYAFSSYGLYSISDPIQFTNTATGDYVSIAWNFGDGSFSNEDNPKHTYIREGQYIITQTVTYPYGCVYVHTISVIIEKGYQLIVPSGFTPNNDTVNDNFGPLFSGLNNVKITIYDTWGELIYSEEGATLKGWDGKVNGVYSENGNYYYRVSAETFYGTTITEDGPFTLIK